MSTPIIQLQSAFEHFNEYRSTLKMTTGSPELDSIIDSIQQGQFYLFYGTNRAILDGLVYGLLVNCILPIKEHGFESMAMYINNVDYYQPDKSNVLSAEKIAIAAKCRGIEPITAFKNIFIQIAYNETHQLAVAKQVAEFIESKEGEDIRLLVINNLTKFFRESKDKNRSANVLKEVLGFICKACAKRKIALVCTSKANITSKGIIARPIGGTYCKHNCKFKRESIFDIQGHFGKTSICQDTKISGSVYKESGKSTFTDLIRNGKNNTHFQTNI